MIFKSTMGNPLTEEECNRISQEWTDLYQHALSPPGRQPDPLDMLKWITDTIMKCWAVRQAISDGWYHANKRAEPKPRPRVQTLSDLTPQQLDEILDAIAKRSHE